MTSTKTLCKRDFTLKYGARKKDFHIRPYADAALADVTGKRTTRQHAETVTQFLGEKAFKEVIRRLTRKAFFIEPAISTVNTTHYAHRWYEGSHFYEFNRGDPRWCDYKSCKEIFAELLQSLATDLADPVNRETLNDFLKHNLDPYELPIGYVDDTTSTVPWIHRPGNLEWIWAGPSKETIAFRTALEEIDCEYPVSLPAGATQPSVSNVPLKEIMSGILKKKIKTKTHLTDRVQVGEHQTDREKRWECHPDSVHYSSLEEAWRIEHRLLTQLVNFQDFPQEVRSRLAASGLIVGSTHTEACPITGDALRFDELASEIMSRKQGESEYQVGHMKPLKAVGREERGAGHTATNISWISNHGNRIQGSLSVEETEALIKRIAHNKGWIRGPASALSSGEPCTSNL